LPTSNDADSSHKSLSRVAAVIHTHRAAILERWLDLIEFDRSDPAFAFVSHQLDASLLALAGYLLGEDPEESRMASLWGQIQPNREMVAGASISMSLLAEALRSTLAAEPDVESALSESWPVITRFTRMVILRILQSIELDGSDERWDEISKEVEARYERQRSERIRRLGVLIDIAHAVSTVDDLDSLFEHIHTVSTRISTTDYTRIALLDHRTGDLVDRLVFYQGVRRRDLEGRAITGGLAEHVATSREPLAVTDYDAECQRRGLPMEEPLGGSEQRGWMAAPMVQGQQTIGVISASCPLSSFEREDVELLAAVAQQAAVAIENRRLIETQRRHVKQLRAVNQLARRIVAVRDPYELLDTAVDLIHELFGYGLVSLFLADADGRHVTLHARSPVPAPSNGSSLRIAVGGHGIIGAVSGERTPLVVPDVSVAPNYLSTEETRSTRAEMAVPVIHTGELLGVLDVQSPMVHAFDESDLTTLHTIADQLAVALENARLFRDEAERRQELALILSTTRAAGSSLELDEVLERLAAGIAKASAIDSCLICLLDETGRYLSPEVMADPNGTAGNLYRRWNHLLTVSEHPEIEQAIVGARPVLFCRLDAERGAATSPAVSLLVPLALNQRVLGIAVLRSGENEGWMPQRRIRLIQGIADSAALAIENARLYAGSQGLAIAEERGRLAREIHDGLAQGLTAISLQLDLADSYLPARPEHATKYVRRALELTRQNLDEARRSVLDLQAGDVHRMPLPEAIEMRLQRLAGESGIEYELINDGLTSRMPARVEIGLYRIVEEALENARLHSTAENVRVQLEAENGTVSVLIEDDGCGFDPATVQHAGVNGAGFGLVGIRERARLLGGSLNVWSRPDCGTSLRVTVPYEDHSRPAGSDPARQGESA
jgi:two-component system, NarL family, sensor kinase